MQEQVENAKKKKRVDGKIISALIAGVCSLAVGVMGTLGVTKAVSNSNVVNVNINGEKIGVSPEEYQSVYNELKNKYDGISSENQNLKNEIEGLKAVRSTNSAGASSAGAASSSAEAYIGEQIKAYYSGLYYREYSSLDGSGFYMGSQKYNRGFTIAGVESSGEAYFNLDGKYSSLSGLVGNLDDINYGTTFAVYGDDKLLSTLEIEGAALPKEFSIDVSGVRQLKIIATKKDMIPSGFKVGFANVLLK